MTDGQVALAVALTDLMLSLGAQASPTRQSAADLEASLPPPTLLQEH